MSIIDQLGTDAHTKQLFVEYHKANPEVWKYFLQFAREIRASGRKHYGAKSIMERVRFDCDIKNPNAEFKINNNFTALYARCLALKYPQEFGNFFEFRTLHGLKEAA